jgi:hypothetical protein
MTFDVWSEPPAAPFHEAESRPKMTFLAVSSPFFCVTRRNCGGTDFNHPTAVFQGEYQCPASAIDHNSAACHPPINQAD